MYHEKKWLSKSDLISALRNLGLKSGDLLMVHASLRAVGEVLGGPDELISALLESIGPGGTMMMYLGCQMPFDDVGRGIFTSEQEEFIVQNCPAFDPTTARASRDFGALAEFFRTSPGVEVTANPGCRMGAIGPLSDKLLKEHSLNYGLGKGSPLERLCNHQGKVLLLGSDLDAVTLLHYAEAIAPIENKKLVHIRVPLMIDGEKQWVEVEEFNSSTGICDWPDEYFAIILRKYIAESRIISSGKVGKATCYLFSASDLVDFAVPIMVKDAAELTSSKS